MVFVPHEDDEVLLAGGIIENYVRYNSEIFIVLSTAGDYNGNSEIRMNETIEVMQAYGIEESHVVFLGYGDQWSGDKHIYNSDDNTLMKSHIGKNKTYALKTHPAYNNGISYTRNNYLNDIKSVILDNKPDTIFCVDCDRHSDHIALSLLFEEAMGEILKENNDYFPQIFKGMAYSLAMEAPSDYSLCNNKSTVNPYQMEYMKENHSYLWDSRVRFPVYMNELCVDISQEITYNRFKMYDSQKFILGMSDKVINGDKVFWNRRTDSLSYCSDVTVSSGNADVLTDYKLVDSENVNEEKILYDGTGVWVPKKSDDNKTVTVKLRKPTEISQIVLYDNPSLTDNIIQATITFDDGSSIKTGKLIKNGSETKINFESKVVSEFSIQINETEGQKAGISEIEVYNNSNNDNDVKFIKIMNKEENFVYDYLIDSSGKEEFYLYTYQCCSLNDKHYSVSVDNKHCKAEIIDNKIVVECPANRYCMITVSSKDGVSDTILVYGILYTYCREFSILSNIKYIISVINWI